jgi:deoxyribonuclease V
VTGSSGWWPDDPAALARLQAGLAAQRPEPWTPPDRPLRVAAAFVAFARGQAGPGRPGDRAWVGAVLVEGGRLRRARVVPGVAGDAYAAGLLALREGPMLAEALAPLVPDTDVLLADATGRDHPRGAGLALHLGAALDVPSVGVTHRPLRALGTEPGAAPGDTSPVALDGAAVGAWVRTAGGVRPVVAHAAWRTDVDVAVAVVRCCAGGTRTPEPLRQARRVAREARSQAEGRDPGGRGR